MLLVTGPKRVSARRIVGLPRALLRSVGLEPPVRVALLIDDHVRETILITARTGGLDVSAMVSSVGQVVLPTSLIEALNLGAERAVYVRAREDKRVLEMMSPQQSFVLASARLGEARS
jgi:antitoxin component of MazEF toxin-antitoxin module